MRQRATVDDDRRSRIVGETEARLGWCVVHAHLHAASRDDRLIPFKVAKVEETAAE